MHKVLSIKYLQNIKLLSFFILTALYLLLNTAQVHAQELSLSVNPPITVINAISPTNTTSIISIKNNSDTQVALQIQIKPFKAKGENGELEYPNEALPILKNIQITDDNTPVESITLGPKQEKNLSLNIDISQDLTTSDYYFSVMFVSTNHASVGSNSSINQLGIATNVLLSVGQKEIPKAILQEFSTGIFFEAGPVPFTVRLKNTGDHIIEPTGEIIVKNMFGQSIGKLNLKEVNILTDSTRAIPSELEDNPSSFKQPVALLKEGFLLGLYSATLNLSLSDEGPIFVRTIYFFAFPFQSIIIIVIIAIIIIMVKNKIKQYANKDRISV